MACPEWEAELYKTRVCTSYTCQSCSQEWCTDLCHKLKLDFGACNKVPCFAFRTFRWDGKVQAGWWSYLYVIGKFRQAIESFDRMFASTEFLVKRKNSGPLSRVRTDCVPAAREQVKLPSTSLKSKARSLAALL